MHTRQGKFLTAFETLRNADESGEEIHVLQFASNEQFENYRQDSRLASLKELREQAISATEIQTSSKVYC